MQASALLDARRLSSLARRVDAGDAAVFVLLASVLWLPPLVGNAAWPVAVVLLWGVALARAVRTKRLPPLPIALCLYLLAYVPAALRAASFTPSEGARFFVRPLIVPAVAMVAPAEGNRRRQLALIVAFALTQTLATGWQALSAVARQGRHLVSGDGITGTLGTSQAGIVALVALTALTLLVAGWMAHVVRTRTAVILGAALASVTIFSSMRAAVGLVVVLAVVIGVAAIVTLPARVHARRPLETLAASIVAAGVIYVGIVAIYPNAFVGAISSQSVSALGGVAAYSPVALACSGQIGNAVSDPGFESGIGRWSGAVAGSLALDRQVKRTGAASLRIRTDGRQAGEFGGTSFSACPKSLYTAAAWVKAPFGVPIELELSDNQHAIGSTATGTGDWEFLAVQLPFATSSGYVNVLASGNTATTLWVDDVQVVRGEKAGQALLAQTNPCNATPKQNHISNGDFVAGVTAWRPVNGARLLEAPHAGHRTPGAMRVVSDGAHPDEAAEQYFAACAGRTYSAAAWVHASRGYPVEIALSDGRKSLGKIATGTGAWQYLHVTLRFHTSTGVISLLTPGSVDTAFWVDDAAVLQGRTAPRVTTPRAPVPSSAPPPVAPPPRATGAQLLPGRLVQIKTALSVSVHSGLVDGLLGRGLGASTLQAAYTTAPAVPKPERVGGTWIGVVLVDSGWLGLIAFALLLLWLLVIALRISLRRPAPQRASAWLMAVALPGLAALTLFGAVLTTILDVRGYSILFWVLVGLGVSAALDAGVRVPLLGGARAAAPRQRSAD